VLSTKSMMLLRRLLSFRFADGLRTTKNSSKIASLALHLFRKTKMRRIRTRIGKEQKFRNASSRFEVHFQ